MTAMNLYDAKNIDGSPRFYPVGQHPATARWRAQLAKAEATKAEAERMSVESGVAIPTDAIEGFIAYIKDQIATFEARESEVKADWLRRYGDA